VPVLALEPAFPPVPLEGDAPHVGAVPAAPLDRHPIYCQGRAGGKRQYPGENQLPRIVVHVFPNLRLFGRYRPALCRTIDGWRALPPALAENSCGCFLPDLTRFT